MFIKDFPKQILDIDSTHIYVCIYIFIKSIGSLYRYSRLQLQRVPCSFCDLSRIPSEQSKFSAGKDVCTENRILRCITKTTSNTRMEIHEKSSITSQIFKRSSQPIDASNARM